MSGSHFSKSRKQISFEKSQMCPGPIFKITAKRSEMNQKEVDVAVGEFSYIAINDKNKTRKFKPNLKI